MNDNRIVESVTEALRGLGLGVSPLKPAVLRKLGADRGLRIGKGGRTLDLPVDVIATVTHGTAGAIANQLRQRTQKGQKRLLITRYVAPAVAEQLRVLGVQFADMAGNAYIQRPQFLVYVIGRKRRPQESLARAERTISKAGIKVVFALLSDPELAGAPQRGIARAADVALGVVPGVLANLRARGYLVTGTKRSELQRYRQLLDEWALAYARILHPKTLVATFSTPTMEQWRTWRLPKGEVFWGGEPAAALLSGYLRPGILTLYAERLPSRLMIEQRLTRILRKPPDYQVLELRTPFWGETLRWETRLNTAPPVLVYADLLATGDARCIETAQRVFELHIARPSMKA